MPFPYDAKYTKEDVVALVDAIAPFWRKPASQVPDLDVAKLFETLKRVVGECRKLDSYTVVDKEMQALLALTSATPWFSEAQVKEIDTWLDEVSDIEDDWMSRYPEDKLREIILKKLKAKEVCDFTADKVGKAISVEYKGGNYGQGRHDGCLNINDDSLRLYDYREPGKYLVWLGDLPEEPEDLGRCLASSNWDIGWDEGEG
mmetsp:Transcript_75469/g.232971  ORF Transcript_75469/g.232971 Transcript_75469/m.232971 type:complete len:202 (-) Transcript_75469:47-652(-)